MLERVLGNKMSEFIAMAVKSLKHTMYSLHSALPHRCVGESNPENTQGRISISTCKSHCIIRAVRLLLIASNLALQVTRRVSTINAHPDINLTTPQVGPTRRLTASSAMPRGRFISPTNLWLTQSVKAHWPNIIERM